MIANTHTEVGPNAPKWLRDLIAASEAATVDVARRSRQIDSDAAELARLRAENAELRSEIAKLKTGGWGR